MYIETARQWDAVRWDGTNLTELQTLLGNHGLSWTPFVSDYAVLLMHDIADPTTWDMVNVGQWLLVSSIPDPNGYGRVLREVRVARDDGTGAPLGFAAT